MADPLQAPALQTPSCVISQFPTTYSSEQAWFYVAATLSVVFPGTLLLLRLYTKIRIVRSVDLIDCATLPVRIFTEREYPLTDECRYYRIIVCELSSGKTKSERVHLSFLTHIQNSQLFLIVLIVVARLGFVQGAGVHQWNLPKHNFNTLQYVCHTSRILESLDLGLITSPVALHRSDPLQPHPFPDQDGYSLAIRPLIRTSKTGGSFHVVQRQDCYCCCWNILLYQCFPHYLRLFSTRSDLERSHHRSQMCRQRNAYPYHLLIQHHIRHHHLDASSKGRLEITDSH